MPVFQRIEILLWPPKMLWHSIILVLSYPLQTTVHIFRELFHHYSLLQKAVAHDQPVTFGLVWGLIEWGAIALLTIVLPFIILKDTFDDISCDEQNRRRGILYRLFLVLLRLISYYIITSICLYFVFNFILPEKMIFHYLGK